jgi:hypothetical protein
VCKPRSGDINRVSGENIVALGKAGIAAAAQGHSFPSIVRMPLGMRITTRDLYAQLTPCGDWFRYRYHTLRRLCRPCMWLPYLRRYADYFAALPLFPTQRAIRLQRPSVCGHHPGAGAKNCAHTFSVLSSQFSVLSSQFSVLSSQLSVPGYGRKKQAPRPLLVCGACRQNLHIINELTMMQKKITRHHDE